MNKKANPVNSQYLLVTTGSICKRLLTSFFIIFFLFSGFMPYVFADEIGYEPQASQYTEAVDEGGKTPQGGTPSVDTSTSTANVPKPSQGVVDMATGAFTYSYDFHLPEGQNGYTPPFSMSYNSNNGHIKSVVGKGWKLDIPEIVRLNKNGVERMYDETNFSTSFDGDLVKVSKEKDQFGSYGVKNGYGTYTYEKDGSWTYKDKSGFTYLFGITSKDREGSVGKYSKWMLSKITDNHGLEYIYISMILFKDVLI